MQIGAKALGANRLDLNCWRGLLGSQELGRWFWVGNCHVSKVHWIQHAFAHGAGTWSLSQKYLYTDIPIQELVHMLSTFSFLGQVKSPALFSTRRVSPFSSSFHYGSMERCIAWPPHGHTTILPSPLRAANESAAHSATPLQILGVSARSCGCEPLTLSAIDRSHHLRLPSLDKNCFSSDVQWMPERAWDFKAVKPDSSLFHTHMPNKLLEV